VAISTPDPAATVALIKQKFNGSTNTAIIAWDIVRGYQALTETATTDLVTLFGPEYAEKSINPVSALEMALELPERAILVMHNAHRIYAESEGVVQGIWNLRDPYKATGRMCVLLAPAHRLPVEIAQDTLVLDDPLPDAEALAGVAQNVWNAMQQNVEGFPDLVETTRSRIVDATVGLSSFAAEQAIALSLTGKQARGIDLDGLWERKRVTVEQTPGISIWRGGESFKDVMGYWAIKDYLEMILHGKQPPRAVLYLDELDKSVGTSMDTSGVSQSLLGTLLSWMQDRKVNGLLMVGPGGSGKSNIAKATGGEAGIPTIQFDLTGMRDSLVGSSEARLRTALSVVDAVAQGQLLVMATCNNIAGLPPELRRRFALGTWYVDLPDATERRDIWELYFDRYEIPWAEDADMPNDTDWSGAEIWKCVDLAWRLDRTPKEAGQFIVPIAKAAPDQIKRLREEAHGRYLSASYAGLFDQHRQAVPSAFRKLEMS
jgi:hypothetical protein